MIDDEAMDEPNEFTRIAARWYVVWLVAFVALGLRLFQLGEWSLWHDEALSILLAQQPINELIAITAADVHPPLYFLLLKPFLTFGQIEYSARILSVLCSAGVVVVIYYLGSDLFDARVGLVSALLMAFAPIQLFYGQEARMYGQLILLATLSIWSFFRALDRDEFWWWVLFVVFAALASYTAYFFLPVLLAMSIYVFMVDKRRERIKHFTIGIVAIIILFLPWVTVFFTQARAIYSSYWIARPSPLELFTTLSSFFVGFSLSTTWVMIALFSTLLLVFMVLNSTRHAIKENSRDVKPLFWLLLWALLPLIGLFLISQVRSIFQIRTVLIVAPAFYLLIGWGVTRAQDYKVNLALFVPTLIVMAVSIFNFYFVDAYAKPSWRGAAEYVEARVQSGDVVVHTSAGSLLPFIVYNKGTSDVLLASDPDAIAGNAPSQQIVNAMGGKQLQIKDAVAGYRRAWLVVGLDHAVEYQLQQYAEFDRHYQLLSEEEIDGISILLYELEGQ